MKYRELVYIYIFICMCMCVCVCCLAYVVRKTTLDIPSICIILTKPGGYQLTLQIAHCHTVKHTARLFWEQHFFAIWSCALRNGTNVASRYCSDCSRAAQTLQENSAKCGRHVDKNSIQYTEWRLNKYVYNYTGNLTCVFVYTLCAVTKQFIN